MTYEEALAYIHTVDGRGTKPGLSRTRELLARLGHPERTLRFVHIGGTNGKGSTAAMIASILQQAGYRVGFYNSPFLDRFNDRLRIDGACIADEELAELTSRIRKPAETMEDKPTEFEIITALGMEYFARHDCDIVVLEVGMGGEWDSTNVISVPEAAVLTSIGLDHTERLGKTIAEIAQTKAGIIKEGGDVVFYGRNPEAETVLRRVCTQRHARLTEPDYGLLRPRSLGQNGQTFDYGDLHGLFLPLLGRYQLANAAVAITAVRVLSRKGWAITPENIREGLAQTDWRGRMERLGEHPTVILDGSHNPQGMQSTAESLRLCFGEEKILFVVGMMADKNVEGALRFLCPLAGAFFAVTPDFPGRALPAEDLAQKLRAMTDVPVTVAGTPREGCVQALAQAGRDGIVCITGSLYMVGACRTAVRRIQEEERDGVCAEDV